MSQPSSYKGVLRVNLKVNSRVLVLGDSSPVKAEGANWSSAKVEISVCNLCSVRRSRSTVVLSTSGRHVPYSTSGVVNEDVCEQNQGQTTVLNINVSSLVSRSKQRIVELTVGALDVAVSQLRSSGVGCSAEDLNPYVVTVPEFNNREVIPPEVTTLRREVIIQSLERPSS